MAEKQEGLSDFETGYGVKIAQSIVQYLPRHRRAFAAVGGNTKTRAQLPERTFAFASRFANLVLGYRIAQADRHGFLLEILLIANVTINEYK